MNISDRAQEILEKYWIENKERGKDWKIEYIFDDPVIKELVERNYAEENGHILELTQKGLDEAKNCVRRHRLAECLLSDVLDIRKEKIHDIGCQFEHLLQKDVEENICTLLGHPLTCPHGKPIPRGNCCKDNARTPQKLILPLSECEVNNKGKIAYIKTDKEHIMNKLTAMGVIPGLSIQLLRRTPTYLFQMGESQFAIDHGLAEKIQIRLSK